MAYSDQASLAADPTFQSKVHVAMMSAATSVASEAASASPVTDSRRFSLATRILADGGASSLNAFVWAVASYNTINAQSPDSDIQFVVNSLFSGIAGVNVNNPGL